jgi:phosphodiesterase/alkaline phosphatase D-like protein
MPITPSSLIDVCRSVTAVTALLVAMLSAPVLGQNTLVPAGENPYQPSAFPDRILLNATQDPATSLAVSWRTHADVADTYAQISVAADSPALHLTAELVQGSSTTLETMNGTGRHHQALFNNLLPDTLYAYRVRGDETWSEWFQFRTASDDNSPHTAIYFGDAQNAIKAHFSRVIREAFSTAPRAQVMVHAGDLVNSSAGDNHDNEWGSVESWRRAACSVSFSHHSCAYATKNN